MRSLTLILLFVLCFTDLSAQGTGFDLLSISPSANALSRSEAMVSIPDGSASIYMNPALLAMESTSSIDLAYALWIADVSNAFAGVNLKYGNQSFAFAIYNSGSDDFEQRNTAGPSNGTFSIQYLAISAAYARDLGVLNAGLSFHYLNEESFTYRANGYAFNFGLAKMFNNDRIRTGISLSNIGEMNELNTTATELPVTFRAGISADVVQFSTSGDENLPILISVGADYVIPTEDTENTDYTDYQTKESYLNAFISVNLAETFQLNTGYKSGNNARPVSFGASLEADNLIFNYALVPFNTGFGTVHSIGIQYNF